MADATKLDDLLQLPQGERARLARALLESLDEPDEGADADWIAELEQRARDARSNPQDLRDGAAVRDRLAARLTDR